MTWNIANAKQQFSEVVRLAAEEPQTIYNRDRPVAVLISADEFEAYRGWREQQKKSSLVELFEKIREALVADGFSDGIEIPPRTNRPSPFDDPDYLDNGAGAERCS